VTLYIGVPSISLLKYLRPMAESIVSKHPWKLLVVDNASTDGTYEWATSAGFECIRNPENYGAARSWNQIITWGRSHDDCDAIYILNNDIILHRDTIDRIAETITVNHKDAATGCDIGHELQCMPIDSILAEPRYNTSMNFSCFALSPSTIDRVGLFDENFKIAYFEDNDYHHRLMNLGLDGVCDTWAPFVHFASRTIRENIVSNAVAFDQNKAYFMSKYGFLP
jgi:O-antigen biosynthesis protein